MTIKHADFCMTCGSPAQPTCYVRRHKIEPLNFSFRAAQLVGADGASAPRAPKGRSELRDADDLQLAHDKLAFLILGDPAGIVIDDESKARMTLALDVLCYALNHDHNQTFANNIANLTRLLESAGYTAELLPRVMTTEEARREGYLGGDDEEKDDEP